MPTSNSSALNFRSERAWFASEASTLPAAQCGIGCLLTKIDSLFSEHIKGTWVPRALAHLAEQQSVVELELEKLGPASPRAREETPPYS